MYILPNVGSYIVNSNKIIFFYKIMGCARFFFFKSDGDFWFCEVANVLFAILLKKLLMLQILEDNIRPKNSRVTDDVVR